MRLSNYLIRPRMLSAHVQKPLAMKSIGVAERFSWVLDKDCNNKTGHKASERSRKYLETYLREKVVQSLLQNLLRIWACARPVDGLWTDANLPDLPDHPCH